MDIKVNAAQPVQQAAAPEQTQAIDDKFRFILESRVDDDGLAERLNTMIADITQQGKLIGKKNDIRDMQRYRMMIKGFLNEIVTRSHSFPGKTIWTKRDGTACTASSASWMKTSTSSHRSC